MRSHLLLGTSLLTLTVFAGSAALADITGPDVWDSFVSAYEASGAEVGGVLGTDGATHTVQDPVLLYQLPFDFGSVEITLPDISLTDQADGTVDLQFPDAFDLPVSLSLANGESVSGTFTIVQTGYAGLASGVPGEVMFTQSADSLRMSVKDVAADGETIDVVAQLLSEGYAVTSRVTQGDLIEIVSDITMEPADIAYVITMPFGDVISNTGEFGRTESRSEMALPAGGSNLLDLSTALEAGAYIRGTSFGESNSSETVTTRGNELVSEESTAAGQTEARFSFDASGAELYVDGSDVTFRTILADVVPVPIKGAFGRVVTGFAFPLLPSEDPQDFSLQLALEDLTLDDQIWAMFDPSNALPRDPITFRFDVAGTGTTLVNWLDVMTVEDQLSQVEMPITPQSVTINDFTVSALGASAVGSGSFTLDQSDTQTFPGFARPQGEAIVEVSGANTLLDRLVTLGLLGDQEAGMARMGLGFVARATGDDRFETVVGVNEDGQVFVNGQRMR